MNIQASMRLVSLLFCTLMLVGILSTGGCAQVHNPDFVPVPDVMPPAPRLNNVRVALVLSGGGARGIAHAGVIEVLEKNHIPIDLIVGSSAGSIIGALYADHPHASRLHQKLITLNKWDILDLNWASGVKMLWDLKGPVEGNALRKFLQNTMRAQNFNELQIPLAVVTTDIHHGDAFVIRSGPLVPAIHASSAIPMVFSPVQMYGKTLVDGGVASPIPVEIAKKFNPQIIIAVDIGTSPDNGPVNNAYELGVRSLHISYYKLSAWQKKKADIVIHPAIDDYGVFDDHANQAMYEAGQQAALQAIPQIQLKLARKGVIIGEKKNIERRLIPH